MSLELKSEVGGSGGTKTGYNIKRVNELMSEIWNQFLGTHVKLQQEFNSVTRVFRREWIGEDEYDFEVKFAQRLYNLYYSAGEVIKGVIKNLHSLAESWIDFQSKNTLDGGILQMQNVNLNDVTYLGRYNEYNRFPVNPLTISEDANRGLRDDTQSKTNINAAMEDFKKNVKKHIKDITDVIDTNSAFFGGQSAVKNYVDSLFDIVGQLFVAIKDLYDATEILAGQNYTQSAETVEQTMNEGIQESSNILEGEGIKDTRWI